MQPEGAFETGRLGRKPFRLPLEDLRRTSGFYIDAYSAEISIFAI